MSIYKALRNNDLPIITVLAPSVERARAEIQRQLEKPGRRSWLNAWKSHDEAVRDESGLIHDTLYIDMPSDVTDDDDERANLIILNAREEAAIYALPCDWAIIDDDGELATVRRIRRA